MRRGLVVAGAVFVSGAVVLGMEIAASRVLAPYFGNSLFVWGALIGVVLAGLALGYWAGGWLADRLPTPTLLAGVMGLGALLVLAIPVLDEPVLEAIVRWDPGPRLNPLIAAIALFGRDGGLLREGLEGMLTEHAKTLERKTSPPPPICEPAVHIAAAARRLGMPLTVDERFAAWPVPTEGARLPCDLLGRAIWTASG